MGNDGNIGIPYWDWTQQFAIPSIIRDKFGSWPDGFWPDDVTNHLPIRRNSDADIRNTIITSHTVQHVTDSLNQSNYIPFSTTSDGGDESVESPHNDIHGACGSPMGWIQWAAYDPVFWLHHSNVDRIFDTYLGINTQAMQQFETGNPSLFKFCTHHIQSTIQRYIVCVCDLKLSSVVVAVV